jgi:hypothetical protein
VSIQQRIEKERPDAIEMDMRCDAIPRRETVRGCVTVTAAGTWHGVAGTRE